MLEDPTKDTQTDDLVKMDYVCLCIYTIECCVKIFALGFAFNKKAYLRDWWNILDITIVVTSWLEKGNNGGVKLTALRAMRVLRALKSVNSIKGLKILITALMRSFKPLMSSFAVFFFFIFLFAIGGLQMWMGILRRSCMNEQTGEMIEDSVCGSEVCGVGQICVEGLDNPNFGSTSFDNIFSSLLIVFQCITLEGWTHIMFKIERAFSFAAVIFFIPLVFIGAFFLLNLVLAVLKNEVIPMQFTKAMQEDRASMIEQHDTKKLQDPDFEAFDRIEIEFEDQYLEVDESQKQDDIEANQESPTLNLKIPFASSRALKKKPTMTSIDNFSDDSMTFKAGFKRDNADLATTHNRTAIETEIVNPQELPSSQPWYSRLLRSSKINPLKCIVSENLSTESASAENLLMAPELPEIPKLKTYSFKYADEESDDDQVSTNDKAKLFKNFIPKTNAKEAYFKVSFEAGSLVNAVREQDVLTLNVQGQWSGHQLEIDHKKKAATGPTEMSKFNMILWPKHPWTKLGKARFALKTLVNSLAFNNLMTLCVLANTIALATEHYGMSAKMQQDLWNVNLAFTIIFAIELVLKVIGLGVKVYFEDSMNFLDAFVVAISLIEYTFMSGSSSYSALRALRIFRAFRVFRVARLFRRMESMGEIMRVISATLSEITYLAILLLLLTIIFALVGMQIFGGKFDFDDDKPRANFDSFFRAFVTVFQILTLENWQDVLYDGMRSSAGSGSALYFISWIFIGNYVCLNLFLAILFDSFGNIPGVVLDDEIEAPKSSIMAGSSEVDLLNRKREELDKIMDEVEDSDADEEFTKKKTEKPLFSGIATDQSLFFFSKDNRLRIWCMKVAGSRKFEGFILLVICLSSFKLVWDTYLLNEPSDSDSVKVSDAIDLVILIIFILEMFIKVLAIGFIRKRGSYLRDSWNQLDFLIVCMSIVEISVTDFSLSFIKVFRLFRTLRPLRFISHNSSMKQVVTALFESFAAIINVGIVLLILWLIFAILGVSLFAGKFSYCDDGSSKTRDECDDYGLTWKMSSSNFNNIFEAMLTMFILTSLEGWPDIMYQAVDATDYDLAPERDVNPAAALYFIGFITVVVFFFLNLFVGVIFMKFQQSKLNESFTLLLSKEQNFWVELQQLIVRSKPVQKKKEAPSNPLRLRIFRLVKSKPFLYFVMVCIVINMLVLSIDYYTASADYKQSLVIINLIFTGVFLLEAVLKLIGLGPKAYFNQKWNCFDFFVVVISLLDIFLTFLGSGSMSIIRVGPQLIRVLRIFRVSKLIRIMKSLETIRNLIQILALSLPAVMSVLSLLALVYFVYAILGVFLFHEINSGKIIDDYVNFHDFGFALMLLLRVSTGEDWNVILFDCIDEAGYAAPIIFFVSFVSITTFILLNLFVMVVLQEYENVENNPNSALKVFKVDLKSFKRTWAFHANSADPVRMHYRMTLEVLKELADTLGLSPEYLESKGYIYLCALGIKIDSQGYAYYNDVLFCLLRRKYAKNIPKERDLVKRKIMENLENQTNRLLAKLRKKSNLVLQERSVEANADPWVKLFYLNKILRRWHIWAVERKEGLASLSITPPIDYEYDPGDNTLNSVEVD